MHIIDDIRAIEARLKERGVTLGSILRDAGIDRSTWTRWRAGSTRPRLDRWLAVMAAAEKALSGEVAP